MNILVVLEKTNARNFTKKHDLLLKHAGNWSGKDNDVYVLTNIKKDPRHYPGLHFVNPPKYLFNNILVSLWFSLVNHPRFDFVIEEISFAPFVYRKSEKIMYIPQPIEKTKYSFGLNVRQKLVTLLIKRIFKNSYFITSSWRIRDLLEGLGVKSKKIYLFKKGINFGNKKRLKVTVGKNLLFIANDDLEKIKLSLQIFKMIERRDLDWRFTVLVPKALLDKTKKIYSNGGLANRVRVLENKSRENILREISQNNLLLDLISDENSLDTNLLALGWQIPVIAVETEFIKNSKEIIKSVFMYKQDDIYGMSQNVLDFTKDGKRYQKKVDMSSELVKSYGWKSLSDESLNFLENMRL